MSISVIRATVVCDGCGKQFRVDLDPARKAWERRQSIHSFALDAIRGGTSADGEFCSLQDGLELCETCTSVADGIRPDDENYSPSADEIHAALEQSA